ncbi:hypothetical protein [Gemella cuniculi]|nr:hypothetical protein [Gemella cuniculi]
MVEKTYDIFDLDRTGKHNVDVVIKVYWKRNNDLRNIKLTI